MLVKSLQQGLFVAAQSNLIFAVACSASNYLLGMTPLELPAFMAGTVAGMTVWGVVYASLGGASRSLLKSGMDTEQLFGGQCTALFRSALLCTGSCDAAHEHQKHALSTCQH